MKKIANIVKEMREEISGAEHYAKQATKYKEDDKSLADVYIAIANQELEHVDRLHTQVARIIQAYRAEKGNPPEAMMAVWNFEHEDMMEKVSRIKALIEMYKK